MDRYSWILGLSDDPDIRFEGHVEKPHEAGEIQGLTNTRILSNELLKRVCDVARSHDPAQYTENQVDQGGPKSALPISATKLPVILGERDARNQHAEDEEYEYVPCPRCA